MSESVGDADVGEVTQSFAKTAVTDTISYAATTAPPPLNSSASADHTDPLASSASSTSVLSSTNSAQQHPQLIALRKIDALSEKLQKEGKLLEALQCGEKSLILRGHIFGLESVEVLRACKSVGEMCNYLAMTFLQQDLFDVTLELLKKAEVLTEKHRAVRATTWNNMSCYYRKRGKLRTALNYCRKALGVEAKLGENVKSADTHLNMCTILSELKRHEKAIVHARIALKLLLIELFGDFDQIQQQQAQQQQQQAAEAASSEHEAIATGSSTVDSLRARLPADRVAVLAICYHNLACQLEFLRKYNEALVSYEKATKVVTTHLGASHPLAASLTESYRAAQRKMASKVSRAREHARGGPTSQAGKTPSKLDAHARAAAKNLHAQVQAMPDPNQQPPPASSSSRGFSDGEYDEADEAEHAAGFTSDG